MGYRFSLVLSREITDDESVILQEANCASPIFGADSLPTNAEVAVTKMDFDDTVSRTLAEAIESALESVKKVPDLGVPGLTVPAQPAEPPAEETPAEETRAEETRAEEASAGEGSAVIEGVVVEEPPAVRKATARKPRKASARKVIVATQAEPASVGANGHASPAQDTAGSAG